MDFCMANKKWRGEPINSIKRSWRGLRTGHATDLQKNDLNISWIHQLFFRRRHHGLVFHRSWDHKFIGFYRGIRPEIALFFRNIPKKNPLNQKQLLSCCPLLFLVCGQKVFRTSFLWVFHAIDGIFHIFPRVFVGFCQRFWRVNKKVLPARPRGWPLPWAPELSREEVFWHRGSAVISMADILGSKKSWIFC